MERSPRDGQTVLFEAPDEEHAGVFFIDVATPTPSRLASVSHKLFAIYSSDCRFNFVEIARQASSQFKEAYYELVSDESDVSFWRDGQLLLQPQGTLGRKGRRLLQEAQEELFQESQREYGPGFWDHINEFVKRPNWDNTGFLLSNT